MYKPTFFQDLLQMIETKAVSLFISLVFCISGIFMVYSDIRDDGVIQVKSDIIEGELHTGSVGLIVIFLSAIIVIFCIFRPAKLHSFEVSKGDFSFKWTGKVGSLDHKLIARLQDVVKELQDKGDLVS